MLDNAAYNTMLAEIEAIILRSRNPRHFTPARRYSDRDARRVMYARRDTPFDDDYIVAPTARRSHPSYTAV